MNLNFCFSFAFTVFIRQNDRSAALILSFENFCFGTRARRVPRRCEHVDMLVALLLLFSEEIVIFETGSGVMNIAKVRIY